MVTITRTIHLFFKEYCVIYLAYPVDAIHGDMIIRHELAFFSFSKKFRTLAGISEFPGS